MRDELRSKVRYKHAKAGPFSSQTEFGNFVHFGPKIGSDGQSELKS